MTDLVIFSGLPGTGKSTLAERLARELRWPLLCIDDVIGEVPQNAGIPFWDARIAILLDVVRTQLKLGLSVIADSVFMNLDRQHARDLARRYGARFRPVHVFISDEAAWKERVIARATNNPHAASWENIRHQRERFRPWDPGTALFVNSLEPVERNFDKVLAFVRGAAPNLQPLADIPLADGKYH